MSRIVALLQIATRDLLANPARAAVVTGTMAIAVTVMVIANVLLDSVVGIWEGGAIDSRLREVRIAPTSSAWIDGVEFPTPDTVRFSASQVLALREWLGESAEHVGWLDSSAHAVPVGGTIRGVVSLTVLGDPALAGFEGTVPAEFRDFARSGRVGLQGAIPVVVSRALDRLVATQRGGGTSVGQQLTTSADRWAIVGVAGGMGRNGQLRAWLPATDHHLRRRPASIVALAPRSNDPQALRRLSARVEHWLAGPAREYGSRVTVSIPGLAMQEAVKGRAKLLRAVLSTFALLCIILAAAGVAAVQYAGLPSRLREIGVRRSVGARRSDIGREVVCESALIATAGSSVGVAAGVTLSALIVRGLATRAGQPIDLELRMVSFVLPLLVGVAAALVASLWPAHRAARLDPVTALRYE